VIYFFVVLETFEKKKLQQNIQDMWGDSEKNNKKKKYK
jgi:hypothetical protein